jgi:hypothetical protein
MVVSTVCREDRDIAKCKLEYSYASQDIINSVIKL